MRIATTSDHPTAPTTIDPGISPSPQWEDRAGREKEKSKNNLRGTAEVGQKKIDDERAIGGLRDSQKSVRKQSFLADFGLAMGNDIFFS